ncbi:MAG: hypothetical protein M1817_002050 [Caeruleum heppii]|nr:MAG: hypothetical protein M1817_002050 [Caeruleum heppii]
MADMATPAAAIMATVNAGAQSPAPPTDRKPKTEHKEKPDKPDEAQYNEDLAKAEKEHAAANERMRTIKAKIDVAMPAKGSPAQQRQQDLRTQLSAIRQQQQGFKSSRGSVQEKIRSLDTTLKSRMTEQKNARARIPYKNVDEVDREIQRLEKQVDTGKMKLVEEKKALADISSLRKQRKGFAGFDETQKQIDSLKAQIAELRKGLESPEAIALSEQYSAITKELDAIKKDQDEAYKNINALRDEKTKINEEQQEKWAAIKKIKDAYYGQRNAYRDYEREANRIRKDKERSERDAYEKEKRRKVAAQKLEEASEPAYMDEILTAEGLIRYFDPAAAASFSSNKNTSGPGKFAAQAQRTVDGADIKGTRVEKKDEEDYFMGTGGKKGKKGRKGGAATTTTGTTGNGSGTATPATPSESGGKFNLSMGIIEELGKVDVEPPMGKDDISKTVETLQTKLKAWREGQEKRTKENITKARKEIDRLEADAAKDAAPPPPSSTSTFSVPPSSNNNSQPPNGATPSATPNKPAIANGEAEGAPTADAARALEDAAVGDVRKELEGAKLEDGKGDGVVVDGKVDG